MLNFPRPENSTLSSYQQRYAALVPGEDLLSILSSNANSTVGLLRSLSAEKLNYRYAPGKWSIPEILVHIIDAERIFAYRMLCFSRGEKNVLPGFDENEYATESGAAARNINDIIEEYTSVRQATLTLLKSFSEKQFMRKGKANNNDSSVQILAYMLAGHEIHHINVIKGKYLN